jgi:membrane protease subunit HflC
MKNKTLALIIIVISIIAVVFASAYTVDETEQAVITQFGRVIGSPKIKPGLYLKIPIIQTAIFFPKNLLEWDGEPGQIPTLDKTYIWVDAFARWKIIDPVIFLQSVNNTEIAKRRLDDIIDSAIRNLITSNSLIETVRNTNRELDTFEIGMEDEEKDARSTFKIKTGRSKITLGILKQSQPKLKPLGIELVDVKIKRINYVEQVQQSVYNRMIAERKQIAEKFRSEGKGEANKIIGEKERELKKITSEAYRKAQEIKGKADAQATKIFADAFGRDPEFYSFVKTLEIYGDSFDQNSSLVLSTDSEFLKYLKGYE